MITPGGAPSEESAKQADIRTAGYCGHTRVITCLIEKKELLVGVLDEDSGLYIRL
jgi:hypothetical protein